MVTLSMHDEKINYLPGANGPVLVIEPEGLLRRAMAGWLRSRGVEVVEYERLEDLTRAAATKIVAGCVIVATGPRTAIADVEHIKTYDDSVPVVLLVDSREVGSALAAVAFGAHDYVTKPLEEDRFALTVRRTLEYREIAQRLARIERELRLRPLIRGVVGRSSVIEELARQVERAQEGNAPILIEGEVGTGKDLIARALHATGSRSAGPFALLSCPSIPEARHEEELFGLEQGRFGGMVVGRPGRMEMAAGGTLVIEEVAALSALTQASLLRVLQDGRARRVAGTDDRTVDVRLVCTTSRDLGAEVRAGRFREDLLHRLSGVLIHVPALRERREDVPLLLDHLLERHQTQLRRHISRVHPDAVAALVGHEWPGNVRELEDVVIRSMLACDGEELRVQHLPAEFRQRAGGLSAAQPSRDPMTGFEEHPDEVVPIPELERRAIARALRFSGGNVERAAKLLGMGRATLYRRLAKYDVREKNRDRSEPPQT